MFVFWIRDCTTMVGDRIQLHKEIEKPDLRCHAQETTKTSLSDIVSPSPVFAENHHSCCLCREQKAAHNPQGLVCFTGVRMEWCNDGEILAVGGFVRQPNLDCSNQLRFYTRDGSLRYSLDIPQQVRFPFCELWTGTALAEMFARTKIFAHKRF